MLAARNAAHDIVEWFAGHQNPFINITEKVTVIKSIIERHLAAEILTANEFADNSKGGRHEAARDAAETRPDADAASRDAQGVSGDDLQVGDERLRDSATRDSEAGDGASSLPQAQAPVEQEASETRTFVPATATHPSVYILEELFERDWSLGELAWRMLPDPNADNNASRQAAGVNMLALQMYILCGPSEPDMRIDVAPELGRAFGVSAELFLNLERAWLSAQPAIASKDQRIAELERENAKLRGYLDIHRANGNILIDRTEELKAQ